MKNLAVYLVLIVLAVIVAQYFMQQNPNIKKDFSYSDLISAVNEGRIKEITIIGNEEVQGTINNQRFVVPIPSEIVPELMEIMLKNEVKVNTKPRPTEPWWTTALIYFLPIIIIIVAWVFIIQKMQGGGSQMMSFGKSRARLSDSEKRVTFDDVANYEEVKEELIEVVEFLKNPRKFTKMGAKIPKGVLLVGPPGTGKTFLARAVAGEAGVPFFIISGSDFVEMFVGVGASRVRDLFEQGKRNSPCIIFIDELDAVGRQRGAGLGGGHDEREQTLNQLLVEMDGFETNEGIIVMAATNRPDVLDPALLRPGRFDRQIVVDYPDVKAREGILRIHLRDKPVSDDVDIKVLAKRTPGFTGADMENLANEAAILAVRSDKKAITMEEFDEAIDRVIAGPARKSKVVSEKEKNLIAYHETGHAILGELLEHGDRTHKVTIIPRGRAGGYTVQLPEEETSILTKKELLARVTILLGGRAAEATFLDDISTGAQNDMERATRIVRAMVTEYGMSEKMGPLTLGQKHDEQIFLGRDISRQRNYSEEVAAEIDREVSRIINQCYEKALTLLKENTAKVERIVRALKERETLNAEDIRKLMKGEPLEPLDAETGTDNDNKKEKKSDNTEESAINDKKTE
ncbi:MAG: ATP-dependent metallopeptidase FtsH/Yme1/Tma family protein [Halanaerobiaceae bacterium]|jgi:cell division protease FtsH|nr:ATP-dependent metallopeptidase FtsH/Yme1/Tma family protein [Halanaerobiaceae bacterium]